MTPEEQIRNYIRKLGDWRGQDHVKVNFFKGASLKDSHGLFNAGLEAKTSRSIDIYEGDRVNEPAVKDLVRAAARLNASAAKASERKK
jgi:hypothetical protein